ncbi:hypothetical protein [Methanobacterium formicicum]|nr:hypothetical protein [Methanobacterium formicicum]
MDEILLENIQEAAFGPVITMTLYEWVTLKTHHDRGSCERLAEANDIGIM